MIKIIKIGDLIFEGSYKVHSDFKNIKNFINEDYNILSLANNEKYLNPNSIILNELLAKSISRVMITKNEIFLNDQIFIKKELPIFYSEFYFSNFSNKTFQDFKTYIIKNIVLFHPLSLAFLIEPKFGNNFKTKFQQAFLSHMQNAINKIENGEFIQGFTKIKGAGIGLTPGGDDFIAGCLHALNLIEKTNKKKMKIKEQLFNLSLGQNLISNTMLFHAYKGARFKYLKDFQESIINNDKNININFKNLLSSGETSGSDLLTGLYFGLKHFN